MSWDNVPLDWLTQEDGKVCPDCEVLGQDEAKPLDEWETVPGNGDTRCQKRCRCTLLPLQALGVGAKLSPVIDLRETESLTYSVRDMQYFAQLTEQIDLWEIETGDLNLPIDDPQTETPGFYSGKVNQLEFVKRFRDKFKSRKLSEVEIRQIQNANRGWIYEPVG